MERACDAYAEWFLRDFEWLESELDCARAAAARDEIHSVVVLTHHAPLLSADAVCERSSTTRLLDGSKLFTVGCEGTNIYASLLQPNDPVVRAWCYGHTHKAFSMRHGGEEGALIVSNPVGQPAERAEGELCPCCVITVPRSAPSTQSCECAAHEHYQ